MKLTEYDGTDIATGLVSGMPEAEYHSLPALSGTGVKRLLESPADYKWERENPCEPSPAMAFGTLVHALTLGTYEPEDDPFNYEPPVIDPAVIVAPFDSFRTKEAKEWKALQELEGKQVVSQSVHATMLADVEKKTAALEAKKQEAHTRAQTLAHAVHDHEVAGRLLDAPGVSEVAVFGEHRGAPLRGKLDRLPDEGPLIDLKTARNIGLRHMAYAMDDFGYALQLAHYALLADRLERPYIIAVRNEGRPAAAVYRIGEQTWSLALAATRGAWDLYADCMESGIWPDPHDNRVLDVDLPYWALDRLETQTTGTAADETIAALEELIGENDD